MTYPPSLIVTSGGGAPLSSGSSSVLQATAVNLGQLSRPTKPAMVCWQPLDPFRCVLVLFYKARVDILRDFDRSIFLCAQLFVFMCVVSCYVVRVCD